MAKCPELDLITEMDTHEAALNAILESLKEYAEDYKSSEEIFIKSPNRAYHKPYVDKILECKDKWRLYELIPGRYYVNHIFDCYGFFHKSGFTPAQRINVPLTWKQFAGFNLKRPEQKGSSWCSKGPAYHSLASSFELFLERKKD